MSNIIKNCFDYMLLCCIFSARLCYCIYNDNNKSIDINQITLSFDPDRKITLKSLGNYLRHTRGSQIHNENTKSSRHRGGKINKKTKKHKSRKNRTKRRKYKLVNKTLKKN